jgi:2-polyprenyl-3-methyl-5-hydroxy-6-metoxy-1,4-benzoquinol methylase
VSSVSEKSFKPSFLNTIAHKNRSLWLRLHRFIISQRFGFSPTKIYDTGFFSGLGCDQGARRSKEVVDVLIEFFHPTSVFDVGCGGGFYLYHFAKSGILSVGCEGSDTGISLCPPESIVFKHDLRYPLRCNRTFDLILCIEVAEHLPSRFSEVLVKSVANLASKHVVFTASPPGSEGDDHINCREPEFWDALFNKHGFMVNGKLSAIMRRRFQEIGSATWLQIHLTVYDKKQ